MPIILQPFGRGTASNGATTRENANYFASSDPFLTNHDVNQQVWQVCFFDRMTLAETKLTSNMPAWSAIPYSIFHETRPRTLFQHTLGSMRPIFFDERYALYNHNLTFCLTYILTFSLTSMSTFALSYSLTFIWHIVISNSAIFSLANDLTFCLTHIYYIIYIYCDICLDIIFNNNFQHLFWHILWNFIWHNTMLQFCLEYIVTCLAFCLQAREVQHMTPTLAKWSRFGHQGNDARLFIFQSGWRHDQGGAWVESCALIDAKNMQPGSAHSKLAKVRKCVCW